MDTILEISNMEPFSEVFFKDCYSMAFFQVIIGNKRSIVPILLSGIDLYTYKRDSGLKIQQIMIKNEKTILKEIGIRKKCKKRSNDLAQDVVRSINKHKPVIIWIDRFYETIVPYFYQTIHSPHTILIYGYNENEKYFKVIEDKNSGELHYEKSTIGYNDLISCYNGFLANMQQQVNGDTYFEYTLKQKDADLNTKANLDRLTKVFINNMLQKENTIFNSLNNIPLFTKDIKQSITDEHLIGEYAVNLRDMCWWIIQYKLSESFTNRTIFEVHFACNKIIEEIVENWRFLFNILSKFILTHNYRAESFNTALKKIEDTFRLENQYHEEFFKFLRQV
jgi:hypothetical protein